MDLIMQSDSTLENLKSIVNLINNRLSSIEDFIQQHMGQNIGSAGALYPHPYLSVRSIDFGHNIFRADSHGIMMTTAPDGSRGYWLSVPAGFIGNPSILEDIGLLRGAFTGYGGGSAFEYKMNVGASWTRYGALRYIHTHDTIW